MIENYVKTDQVESTRNKILGAAIDLMSRKGYDAVSIKEIAKNANVSEMTVYRIFETKKNILNEILVDKFHYSTPMTELFNERLVWDLEEDLLLIIKVYLELMERNKHVYLVSISVRHEMPEIHEEINRRHPVKLKKLLVNYFEVMQQKGKVIKGNPEVQASMLMNLNYGKFVSSTLGGNYVQTLPLDDYLPEVVRLLVRGLSV